MKCSEIIRSLNGLAPEGNALEWDNPGLLCGRTDREVKKILLAVDATDEVVEQAAAVGADMLITHHPLIFKPIKRITNQDFLGRRLLSLIQADISCYALHTNYDAAPGCMADLAAARLKLAQCIPLEVTGESEKGPLGIGRVGVLPEPMTVLQAAKLVRECFRLPYVTVYGTEQSQTAIRRVAVSPGSGGGMLRHALNAGAEILITGDVSHHEGIDAAACHLAVIDAGHYGLEYICIDHFIEYLKDEFGSALELVKAREDFPAKIF